MNKRQRKKRGKRRVREGVWGPSLCEQVFEYARQMDAVYSSVIEAQCLVSYPFDEKFVQDAKLFRQLAGRPFEPQLACPANRLTTQNIPSVKATDE